MLRLPVMPSNTLRHRLRLTPPSASIRRTSRKNYLRPKILKTLTKPLTSTPPLEIVPEELTVPNPIPFPPENETFLDAPLKGENFPADEVDKVVEFQASETVNRGGILSNISGKFVLKLCVYLVGAYLIQTICAFWFMGNSNSSKKEKRVIELGGRGSVLLNGSNVDYFGGAEMEDKINEIREMARESRKREKIEREDDDEDNDIEREIGVRLAKLERRLSSKRENLPGSLMNYLGLFGSDEKEDGVKDKNLDLGEDMKNLMFKKNPRFGSPPMNSRTSPKGFSGSNSTSGSDSNGQSVAKTSETDTEREAMNKQLNSSQTNGDNLKQEKGLDSVTESSRSKKLDTEVNQKARRKPNGFASSSKERSRDSGKRPKTKLSDKRSSIQADSWWLKLPYVLAILMRRGPEHEASGLFSLRTDNRGDSGGESSYTVAFEDRGDANNFCYLLEAFFEDLGDFRADIVPLSTKDIEEEVKSRTKKIIVVKKGQLKLYAGQPFEEVEIALQSLIGQD